MANIKYTIGVKSGVNFENLLIDAGYTKAVLNQENVYFTVSETPDDAEFNSAVDVILRKSVADKIDFATNEVVHTSSTTPFNAEKVTDNKVIARKVANDGSVYFEEKQFTADELTGGEYVIVTHRYNRLDLLKAVTGKEEHTIDVSDTEEVLRVGGVSTLSKKATIDGFLAKWKLHADDVNGAPREYYQFNSDGDLDYGVSTTTELTPTAYHKVSSLGSKVKTKLVMDLGAQSQAVLLRPKFIKGKNRSLTLKENKELKVKGNTITTENLSIGGATFSKDYVLAKALERAYQDKRGQFLKDNLLDASTLLEVNPVVADDEVLEKYFTDESVQTLTDEKVKVLQYRGKDLAVELQEKFKGKLNVFVEQVDIGEYPKEFIDNKDNLTQAGVSEQAANMLSGLTFTQGVLTSGVKALILDAPEVKSIEEAKIKMQQVFGTLLGQLDLKPLDLTDLSATKEVESDQHVYDNSSFTRVVRVKPEFEPIFTGTFGLVIEYPVPTDITVEKDLNGYEGYEHDARGTEEV